MASMVPTTRGSAAGKKPVCGISSRDASSSREPYDWVKVFLTGSKPFSITSAWMRSRRARHRSSGPFCPNRSICRMERSAATQAITLEWTKCLRGPRTSHSPSSGSSQWDSRKSISDRWIAHVREMEVSPDARDR